MRNEDCLPVLKESMKTLMKPIRAVDKISIITYASEVNMLANGIKGNEKQMLLQKIDSLKAEGLTAGSQGMRIAYEICRENYIPKGNNQIILATDGAFRLSKIERKKVKDAAEDNLPIRLTVTGFGQNQKALDILRELSAEGQGSFIPVQNAPESRSMLLDEIKFRSALKK
jgi:Ca-activated chloride channel family protein